MANNTKRFLSLLVALVMVIGLMPVTSFAAEDVIKVADTTPATEIESGAQYVITTGRRDRTAMSMVASHVTGGNKSGIQLAAAATDETGFWTITEVEGGYTISNNGQNVKIIENNNSTLEADAVVQIRVSENSEYGEGYWEIYSNNNGTDYFLNYFDSFAGGAASVWNSNDPGSQWQLFKVVESSWDEIDPYGKRFWTEVEVDTETANGGTKEGDFEKAWDNNPATHWHSNWDGARDVLTGENSFAGVINFTKEYTINTFSFTPRQDDTGWANGDGVVTMASLYVKDADDADWKLVREHVEFEHNQDKKTFCFEEQAVQYVKFVAERSVYDGWVAVSEFDIALDEDAHIPMSGPEGYCTDNVVCEACGTILEEGTEHVAEEDDFNCLTSLGCVNCEYIIVDAQAEHAMDDGVYTEGEGEELGYTTYSCTNEGCDYEDVVYDEPDPSEPDASEPDASEPDASEPDASEPDASEPDASEPDASEPDASEPDASEPDASEPDASEPDASEPDASEPDASEPDASEPDASEPDASEPDASEPDASEPDASEPDASEPDASEPDASEPDASEPDASEPDASEPVEIDFNATKANWTGEADSETIFNSTEGNFEYAWDGNTNTIWHTDWKGADKGVLTGENVFNAEINFGDAYSINQFSFLPRQDDTMWENGSGVLLQASLYVKASEDAEWVCVADQVTFPHNQSLKTFYFTQQDVQFVKLVCQKTSQMGLTDSNGPQGYVAVAEFYIEDNAASDLTITATTQGQGTVTGAPEAPVAIGTSVTLTAVPAEGYTFEGWYNSMDTKVSTDAEYTFPAATNITLSAKFVANTYTVTFDHGYDEQTSTKTVTHGNTVTLPTVTRAGYAFDGWFDAEGNEFTAETVVTGDITVTAKWTELETYTVTFMLDENDSDPSTATVEEGKTLTDLPTPEREGYTFDGWFDAEGNEFTTETVVTGDITVTAKWTEAVVEPSEPDASEPDASEPDASEPDASEPDASEPDASEPDASEPEASEPEYTVPECDKDDNCTLSQFDDIVVTEWYHDGIHFCVEEGIMNGMGEGKFAPTENTTRAQLVMMLYRLAGTPSVEGKTEPFTDVAENDWFYAPVVWAYNSVVVNGVSDTEFAPNASVTREQVATILFRYLGEPEGTGKLEEFPDVADVSEYAVAPLTWAVGEGLITGIAQADGTALLAPTGNATRAQIATILMRYLTK